MGSNMVRALAFSWCQVSYVTPACVRTLLSDINALQSKVPLEKENPVLFTGEKANIIANTEQNQSNVEVSEIQMVVDECIANNKHLSRKSIV